MSDSERFVVARIVWGAVVLFVFVAVSLITKSSWLGLAAASALFGAVYLHSLREIPTSVRAPVKRLWIGRSTGVMEEPGWHSYLFFPLLESFVVVPSQEVRVGTAPKWAWKTLSWIVALFVLLGVVGKIHDWWDARAQRTQYQEERRQLVENLNWQWFDGEAGQEILTINMGDGDTAIARSAKPWVLLSQLSADTSHVHYRMAPGDRVLVGKNPFGPVRVRILEPGTRIGFRWVARRASD